LLSYTDALVQSLGATLCPSFHFPEKLADAVDFQSLCHGYM